jgi:hypothetical protein
MGENSGWKTKVMILGGVSGLLIGLVAAFLFIKNRPTGEDQQKLTSKDGMKLGMGLVSFIKQVIEIGK